MTPIEKYNVVVTEVLRRHANTAIPDPINFTEGFDVLAQSALALVVEELRCAHRHGMESEIPLEDYLGDRIAYYQSKLEELPDVNS